MHTSTDEDTKGNSFYGFAIGFPIMACTYGLGGTTRGAFNPAVAVGISSVGMTSYGNILIFFLGQLLAGVVAAFVFMYVSVVSLKKEKNASK